MNHSSNMCDGQDANNGMLITETRYASKLGRHTDLTHIDSKECRGVRECRIKKTLTV